jgi:hypothetical protein
VAPRHPFINGYMLDVQPSTLAAPSLGAVLPLRVQQSNRNGHFAASSHASLLWTSNNIHREASSSRIPLQRLPSSLIPPSPGLVETASTPTGTRTRSSPAEDPPRLDRSTQAPPCAPPPPHQDDTPLRVAGKLVIPAPILVSDGNKTDRCDRFAMARGVCWCRRASNVVLCRVGKASAGNVWAGGRPRVRYTMSTGSR